MSEWRYTQKGKDFHGSNEHGCIAVIRKNPPGFGPGYIIDPLLGFEGKNPFGCWVYRNIVAAKRELERVAR